MRRHSLGFEFPPSSQSTGLGSESAAGSCCGDWEEADGDSAFVDDDLESSWDQLRMRQFKEQLSVTKEEAPARAAGLGGAPSLFIRLMKKLMMVKLALFANGGLDKYEKVVLVLAVLLIADTAALTYLLATYPVYRDLLSRLGYQVLFNSTGFFAKASPLRDL